MALQPGDESRARARERLGQLRLGLSGADAVDDVDEFLHGAVGVVKRDMQDPARLPRIARVILAIALFQHQRAQAQLHGSDTGGKAGQAAADDDQVWKESVLAHVVL